MDDSTKPRPATNIAVTGKKLHITREGVMAEWDEDGKQRTSRMTHDEIFPLQVGGQTVTLAQGKAMLYAMFDKLADSGVAA
jgi:hypothetical protein